MLYHPRGWQKILQVLIGVCDGGQVHQVPVQRPLVLNRLADLAHALVVRDGLDDRRVFVQHPLDILGVGRRPGVHLWPVVVHSAWTGGRRTVWRALRAVWVLSGMAGRRGAVVGAC